MSCGCKITTVFTGGSGIKRQIIVYCPKHAAVDRLIEAAKELALHSAVIAIESIDAKRLQIELLAVLKDIEATDAN